MPLHCGVVPGAEPEFRSARWLVEARQAYTWLRALTEEDGGDWLPATNSAWRGPLDRDERFLLRLDLQSWLAWSQRWRAGRDVCPPRLEEYLRPGREHWGLSVQCHRQLRRIQSDQGQDGRRQEEPRTEPASESGRYGVASGSPEAELAPLLGRAGLNAAQMTRLTREDVGFEGQQAFVRLRLPGRRTRRVYLDPRASQCLRELLARPATSESPLLTRHGGRPMTATALRTLIRPSPG